MIIKPKKQNRFFQRLSLLYWNNITRPIGNYKWKKYWDSHPELLEKWLSEGHDEDYTPRNAIGAKLSMAAIDYGRDVVLKQIEESKK